MVANLERVLLIEEISWWQKLKALWLKEGDKCSKLTKVFHKMAHSHLRSNAIELVHFDNCVNLSPSKIHHHIVY